MSSLRVWEEEVQDEDPPERKGKDSTFLSDPRSSRLRSRTTSMVYTSPFPPIISRQNTADNDITRSSIPSTSSDTIYETVETTSQIPGISVNTQSPRRKPMSKRTVSYNQLEKSSISMPNSLGLEASPSKATEGGRIGMKRRISTSNLGIPGKTEETKGKQVESRARSTSTSLVIPQALSDNSPAYTIPTPSSLPAIPSRPLPPTRIPTIQHVHPSTPTSEPGSSSLSTRFLTSIYTISESAVSTLMTKVRHGEPLSRQDSNTDSEKGLDTSESSSSSRRISEDSSNTSNPPVRLARFWGSENDQENDYFSLPPSPTLEGNDGNEEGFIPSLPTPALSAHSLSRGGTKRTQSMARSGWSRLFNGYVGERDPRTAQVIRQMAGTIGVLASLFVITLGMAVWLVASMPITTLKHLPSSTTDLQLLSAEIRGYMASSDEAWLWTIMVVTFVGCWKHAWSVPGAVVLNILVGSILQTIPALALLTFITATGSLGAYLLSRTLAPLIAVLFPKPLSLVRAALAPNSTPQASTTTTSMHDRVTPIAIVPTQTISGSQVWRRLLVMRAGGFVPWSGMNVACGVVGVDWKVFWLTTAAGSASWSYVTASVGNILSRLALPSSPSNEGESLSSLLRDPSLIFKLVILSLLSLLPVLLKRQSSPPATDQTVPLIVTSESGEETPTSPVVRSVQEISPAPFDFLTLTRGGIRQVIRTGMGGSRAVVNGIRKLVTG